MVGALEHRGPDGSGEYCVPGVELGMRRLAIIDVVHGQQPVVLGEGEIVVVFNGEIYNYRQLKSELVFLGHSFGTDSDAEVAAHAYAEWGGEAFSRFRGMFAMAIWDRQLDSLILVRDRLGKKPLLWSRLEGGGLAFASEARALRSAVLGGLSVPSVNFGALDDVLAIGYVSGTSSAFQGIEQVPPGAVLTWRDGETSSRRFWTPRVESASSWSESEALAETERLLDDSVATRLISERPLGAFLSGGIDSTIVAALMARHHDGPVSTFTIGFEDPKFDESIWASKVARHLGTDHHELIITPDPAAWLSMIGEAFDQPFADSSAIPMLLLSKFASESVVVALSGDGGDEVFGGYRRYSAVPALQKLNPLLGLVSPLRLIAADVLAQRGARRGVRLAQELQPAGSLIDRYVRVMTLTPVDVRRRLWHPDVLASVAGDRCLAEEVLSDAWNRQQAVGTASQRLALLDIETYLPGDLLVKADIGTMAYSLEARSPFLDHDVVEFGLGLPHHLRHSKGQDKYLLRQLARKLVPAELIDRPKMGFGVPKADWLRGPLRGAAHDLLLDETARQRGWFVTAEVERLLREHDEGHNRDEILWPLLMIENWARIWVD
jgi:asparagine synthase (glutamine-hydrolysing)